jgi:hypothetical protein
MLTHVECSPAHSPANVENVAALLGGEAQAAKMSIFQRFSAVFSLFL